VNIGITGASGFIGRHLVDLALRRGHEVVAFSRDPARTIPGCEMRRFSIDELPDLRGCDAIVHLAGESIAGLWTAEKRKRIFYSRQAGTRRVVEAINALTSPPEVLVSGSGIGLYRDGGERELDEAAPIGSTFLADTVAAWEKEALNAKRSRVVLLRTSLVLGRKGGVLRYLRPLFRLGLGAYLGDAQQWMSWIHIEDEARLALFALENMDVAGPLNAAAPWPVRNEEFTLQLARRLRRRVFFRAPKAALRLLGEFSRELLESKRVVPASAGEHGFAFQFPQLDDALREII
jgi:uncharacterized protein (TIGR01777 family)